jgi:endonuclease/exonuclease/phosphatase family metal-dependent hydrolase
MRIVSYNILDGGEGRADPLAEVIIAQRPDIVALVEADNLAVLERIAARLKMDFVQAVGSAHAVAILSRWTIRDSVNHAAIRNLGGALVEASIDSPGGGRWTVVVGQGVNDLAIEGAHVLAGEFERAPSEDYLDVLEGVSGGTFTTQDPAVRADGIFLRGVERSRIKDAWVERDRLAKYASDHFPVGGEIL